MHVPPSLSAAKELCQEGAGCWPLLISTGIRNRRASVDSRRVKRRVLFEPLQLSSVIRVSMLRTTCSQGVKELCQEGAGFLISTGIRNWRTSVDIRRVKRKVLFEPLQISFVIRVSKRHTLYGAQEPVPRRS